MPSLLYSATEKQVSFSKIRDVKNGMKEKKRNKGRFERNISRFYIQKKTKSCRSNTKITVKWKSIDLTLISNPPLGTIESCHPYPIFNNNRKNALLRDVKNLIPYIT